MRIAIAARDLGNQFSGPSAYTYGLIQGLIQVNRHYEIHVYYSDSKALGLFPSAQEHCLPISNRAIWDHWALPNALRKDGVDITIFPKGTIPLLYPGKAIPIMLDLGYFHPGLDAYRTLDTLYMQQAMRSATRRAWGIFTISEATRQDVLRLLKAPPGKTLNIYGACRSDYQPIRDPKILNRVREQHQLKEPFIFYPASSISPRKNLLRFINAFESIQAQIPHSVYITGGLAWKSKNVLARLDGHQRIRRLGIVPLEDMAALYTLAEFTVYPSIFEGLGIPVLEAFQCGSPVLTTRQTSLPEIAGNAALLVNGYDEKELAEGMKKMAASPQLREQYRLKGFERAKDFSWEVTANKVLNWIEAHI